MSKGLIGVIQTASLIFLDSVSPAFTFDKLPFLLATDKEAKIGIDNLDRSVKP